MLDAPCGDHSWMSLVDFDSDFCYTGADIVDFMIEQNINAYPDKKFLVLDICQDPLPTADLLFCRDCLFHLSYSDVQRAFANFARSNFKYIMTTTYIKPYSDNRDIATGQFRPLDLLSEPFNLPPPMDAVADGPPGEQIRQLAMWPREVFAS
jgi:hypothetical protein